ncbi:MAG: type II toxin-antitoxin system RelE/ParE family toxin [Syntrophales bacterium]|nr:type II toxin-antitoxin system RelE/ParE family toxin [Syntrophales bacterium]
MRIFKNKWFNRWARREKISDTILLDAATDIVADKVDADLGGCLFKKRIARAGSGKREGYRIIVGYKKQNADRIIFLYAFAKSEKANISLREESALSLVAEAFISATDKQVNELIARGSIWEVRHHE